MRRIMVYVFCLGCAAQLSSINASESSDDFKLYTNAQEAPTDNSANEEELMVRETLVGDDLTTLCLFAGIYVIVCCCRKVTR